MSEVTPLRRCATCDRHFEGAQFCPDDGTPLVVVAEARGEGEDAWVGSVLAGRYRVLGVLGRGGMGVVYEAEQRPFGRLVALKRLRVDRADEAKMRARFEREALAVSRLKSPWTVRLLDVVHDESGEPFIVMERLVGESLRARLMRAGPLPTDEVVRIVEQVARALAEAHAAGVLHRDLKPDNIILEPIGGRLEAKLLDFGIARLDAETAPLTDTSQVPGTPHYLAPERIAGERPGAPADIYALGVVAYELLTGSPPYVGTPWEIMQAHTQGRPRALVEAAPECVVAAPVEALLRRMMARTPELRFADGEALVGALEALAESRGVPGGVQAYATDAEQVRPAPRARVPAWAALVVGGLVGGAVGVVSGAGGDEGPVVVRQVVSWPVPLVMVAPAPVVPVVEAVAPATLPTAVVEPPATTTPRRKPQEPVVKETGTGTPTDPNQVRIDTLLP